MRKKILAILICFLVVFTNLPSGNVYGASSSLSVSSSSVTLGNTVKVTLRYSGATFGSADASITYNPDVLQFVSGSGTGAVVSGGGGTARVSIVYGSGSGASSLSCTLTFKAVGVGSSSISAITSNLANFDGESVSFNNASASVSVKNPTSSGSSSSGSSSSGSSSGSSSSQTPAEGTNNNLGSLTTSCGVLSPAFSKDITEYKLYITEDDKECVISAKAEDSEGSVKVSGSSEITEDTTGRTITVTAENGVTKDYKITYEILTEEMIILEDKVFEVLEDVDPSEIPKGFSNSTIIYNETQINAYVSADNIYIIVMLKDDEGKEALYLYNEEEETFTLANTVEVEGEIFILDEKDYKLVYGDNGEGSGYYVYNPEDESLIFISGIATEAGVAKEIYMIAIALGSLLLLAIILQIIILTKGKGPKKVRKKLSKKSSDEEYASLLEDMGKEEDNLNE